ncbi:hypothetical protein Pelo_12423 [Pelomyxa schiedti]|nr:hypothetical protein Pelo_12423 [Pelomyxa schiedti]
MLGLNLLNELRKIERRLNSLDEGINGEPDYRDCEQPTQKRPRRAKSVVHLNPEREQQTNVKNRKVESNAGDSEVPGKSKHSAIWEIFDKGEEKPEPAEKESVLEPGARNCLWWPNTDFKETESHYEIKMELPGVDKANIRVDLSAEGILSICGNKNNPDRSVDPNKSSQNMPLLEERKFGVFSRCFPVPDADVEPESINAMSASLNEGVLSVLLPKKKRRGAVKITVS